MTASRITTALLAATIALWGISSVCLADGVDPVAADAAIDYQIPADEEQPQPVQDYHYDASDDGADPDAVAPVDVAEAPMGGGEDETVPGEAAEPDPSDLSESAEPPAGPDIQADVPDDPANPTDPVDPSDPTSPEAGEGQPGDEPSGSDLPDAGDQQLVETPEPTVGQIETAPADGPEAAPADGSEDAAAPDESEDAAATPDESSADRPDSESASENPESAEQDVDTSLLSNKLVLGKSYRLKINEASADNYYDIDVPSPGRLSVKLVIESGKGSLLCVIIDAHDNRMYGLTGSNDATHFAILESGAYRLSIYGDAEGYYTISTSLQKPDRTIKAASVKRATSYYSVDGYVASMGLAYGEETLHEGTDYSISYADRDAFHATGSGKVIINGIGRYKDTLEVMAYKDGQTPSYSKQKEFSDVPWGTWYWDYVNYANIMNLMTGYTGTDLFGPEDTLTRAQVATIIYRSENYGSTATTVKSDYGTTTHFKDVAPGQYYTAAVEWCYQRGIVTGYKDGSGKDTGIFGWDDPITREQLATMLWRLSGQPSGGSISSFPDRGAISQYARDAIAWCNSKGIMTGDGVTGKANPQGNATRAQMAKMISVYSGYSPLW